MRLAVRREPFDSPDWLFELKLDGFRTLAFIESGCCRMVSRKAHVFRQVIEAPLGFPNHLRNGGVGP
jgi:hypothetical protein